MLSDSAAADTHSAGRTDPGRWAHVKPISRHAKTPRRASMAATHSVPANASS